MNRTTVPAALAFFGLFLLLVAGLSWQRGAFSSSLGAFDDEAAHAVSALMIRDYALRPEPVEPLAYAKEYYVHYPKVAIGHWPPLFHSLLAGWTLPFGVSRVSLLLFPAAVLALLAVMTEGLLALFCFLAVLGFGRLLDRNRVRDGLLFGLWSVLALLTKGNGMALALVPPFAILLSRR